MGETLMKQVQSPVSACEDSLPDGYYGKNFGPVPVGAKQHPGPTYREMLLADPAAPPPAAIFPGNHEPKPCRIPYHYYWDPEIARLEDEHIWSKMWLVACREEDIRNVGDRVNFDVRDKSYVIVRTEPNKFRAFRNACLHRGRTLCDGAGSGAHIRCQFHGWTYNLDGTVKWIPSESEFPIKDRSTLRLREVRCATWGGNVFINADPKAPPLEEALGVLVELFEEFNLRNRYTVSLLRQQLRVNWKVAQEAFQEAYHTMETHWDSLAVFSETAYSMDVWLGENSHISRSITPTGVPSQYMLDKVSVRDSVEQYVRLYNNMEAAPGRGETITDARNYLAELKRTQLQEQYGVELEQPSNALMLDFVKYFMFPNFHPWWGYQFPITYRFMPIGLNPEECLMEIRMLAPANSELPPSAKAVEVGFDEKCSDYPELGFMGYIADQDVANMVKVQKGMRAADDDQSPILSLSLEKQIAAFYETYEKFLGL